MAKKFGYNTEGDENDVMREMRVDFMNNMARYVGGRTFTKKQTRMDKVNRKSELGFKPAMNPLIKTFGRTDKVMKKNLLADVFAVLKNNWEKIWVCLIFVLILFIIDCINKIVQE